MFAGSRMCVDAPTTPVDNHVHNNVPVHASLQMQLTFPARTLRLVVETAFQPCQYLLSCKI